MSVDGDVDTVAGALVAQMASTPDIVAVSGEDATLTYRELDEASTRLVRAVDHADPDHRCAATGVLVPMGAGAIVGMVAAARSGRMLVTLDVDWPPARIAEILGQVGPTVVLTDRAHADLLPAGTPFVTVDDLPDGLPTGPLELRAEADDPLAITFTSGSTGRPKGAIRTQGSQTAAVNRTRRERSYVPGMRVGLVHEYTFAAIRVPVWGGLGNGITLVVRDVRRHGPTGLARWLAEERIERISLPASLVEAMVEADPPDGVLVDLDHVAFSGDVLRATTIDRLRPYLRPDADIENAYGSSEMGGVAGHHFRADTPLDGPLVPAGTIRGHVDVNIIDPDERGIGELEVHSVMVSAGYVDAATDDRDSFRVDEEGRRWFRSGDLGRIREDGLLEIHGRVDDRVKVRAQAVDPAEVEREVAALDGVREACVLARTVRDETRLVAYVVADAGVELTVTGVRRGLRDRLASWMIPQSVLVLDRIPRTSRGKVDRAALPDPGPERPALAVPHAPPLTPVETAAVRAFEDVLGVDGIGRDDEFFDLGGDSLSAIEVIVHLGRLVGRNLDLNAFRTTATPAAIAARMEEREGEAPDRLVVFHDSGAATPIVHVHSGHGFTISMAPVAATTEGVRPFLGVEMLHRDRSRDLLGVRRLARRYADLLDERRPGPLVVTGYSSGSFLAHAVAAELERRGREIVGLVLLDPPSKPGRELGLRDVAYLGTALSGWRLPMTRRVQERTVASAWGARRHRTEVIAAPIVLLRGELADAELWRSRTTGEVVVVDITGDHRAMLDPPHVNVLGAQLEEALQRLEARSPSASAASGEA